MAEFEVILAKPDFKFNASHFIAYRGYRERLHGHTYKASLRLTGKDSLNSSGYLVEFATVKTVMRNICKELDEYFLLPAKSDVLALSENNNQILIQCEDSSVFSFPKTDCKILPLVHTSSEELARYLWCRVVQELGIDALHHLGITRIELTLMETEGQSAIFRCDVPDEFVVLDSPRAMSIKGVPSFADLLIEDERLQLTNGDDDSALFPDPPAVVIPK